MGEERLTLEVDFSLKRLILSGQEKEALICEGISQSEQYPYQPIEYHKVA